MEKTSPADQPLCLVFPVPVTGITALQGRLSGVPQERHHLNLAHDMFLTQNGLVPHKEIAVRPSPLPLPPWQVWAS